ncbi:hypothetical protein DSECCO2_482760 [anaerobic digester metagenome]
MQHAGLVHLELDLAGLEFLHGLADVEGDGAGLGVGHEAAGAEDLADLAHGRHHVRGGHGFVEVQEAALDLFDQVVAAGEVGAGLAGLGLLVALAEGEHAHVLAQAMGQRHRAAHHLVGILGVDAQAQGHVNGLVELGDPGLDRQGHGLVDVEFRLQVNVLDRFAIFFSMLGHLENSSCARAG